VGNTVDTEALWARRKGLLNARGAGHQVVHAVVLPHVLHEVATAGVAAVDQIVDQLRGFLQRWKDNNFRVLLASANKATDRGLKTEQ
jgi:hypothetical protein